MKKIKIEVFVKLEKEFEKIISKIKEIFYFENRSFSQNYRNICMALEQEGFATNFFKIKNIDKVREIAELEHYTEDNLKIIVSIL